MNTITLETPASFYTKSYSAHRWNKHLTSKPGTWFLVSHSLDFDYMRGVSSSDMHICCAVDDFGDLVRVPG